MRSRVLPALLLALAAATTTHGADALAVRGRTVHTVSGASLTDGVVLIRDGKIVEVGPASKVRIPAGARVLEAEVVTPGLIDAHCTVGVSGLFNTSHDQDQLDRSAPLQPELRALDAYNPLDRLVAWVRSFGVTTVLTGHAPGELLSGQTAVMKTRGTTAEEAVVRNPAAVSVTLGPDGLRSGDKSPGTRGKAVAMLRAQLVKAREYGEKRKGAPDDERPARDLGLEILVDVLERKIPLLITANRAQDLAGALRLREEFGFDLILDSAAEAYLMADAIRETGVPVIVHPTMARPWGDMENASFENAGRLADAGIAIALQGGYESYVPKARVVLFEASVAAANGLGTMRALRAITLDAAKILGVAERVGSLEPGKDADLALFDGDPFEYTSRATATIVGGEVFEHR
jgi:imidazolonepropionase-like amidohydrolase